VSFFNKINRLVEPEYLSLREKQLMEMFTSLLPLTDLIEPLEIVVPLETEEDAVINKLGGNKYYLKYLKYKSKYLKLRTTNI
jgi:hypothetical protein